MIEQFAQLIPEPLKDRSGPVFHSGSDAFNDSKDVYILGFNPGGSPEGQAEETGAMAHD